MPYRLHGLLVFQIGVMGRTLPICRMHCIKLPGGVFDDANWDRELSILHHNDFHYRFYHYLSSKSRYEVEEVFMKEIAEMLAGTSKSLPKAAEKAFRHWYGISIHLRILFDRAPYDAISNPDVVLAKMAIGEIGTSSNLDSVTVVVSKRAEELLARSAVRNRELVEKVIAEPKRLVKAMDDFVALFDSTNNRFSVDESKLRIREFLENCRRLDHVLSDIPRRLRNENGT